MREGPLFGFRRRCRRDGHGVRTGQSEGRQWSLGAAPGCLVPSLGGRAGMVTQSMRAEGGRVG